MAFAEYIWVDGCAPTQGLRSRTRVVTFKDDERGPEQFPDWSFDGSSTGQASGGDCALKPVCVVRDPIRAGDHYLVLCEVFNDDGTKHVSNNRGELRAILAGGAEAHDAWIGFEQHYTLMLDGRPLGFPKDGYPAAHRPYYCGVGADRAFGRDLAERHAALCEQAGLMLYGLNCDALPGRWEFQIGYRHRNPKDEDPSLLNAADHLWLARYLLLRVAEQAGVLVSFERQPVPGDWQIASLHTAFSSATMRAEGGIDAIYEAIDKLARQHEAHLAVYGEPEPASLSGAPESSWAKEVQAGGTGRRLPLRIPLEVEHRGAGYFEDRRPGANADPYLVAGRLAMTVFAIELTRRVSRDVVS